MLAAQKRGLLLLHKKKTIASRKELSDDVKQSRHCLQKENVEKRGKLQSAKTLQAEKERKEPNRIALTTELLLHSAGVGRFHDATRRRAYETRSQFSAPR